MFCQKRQNLTYQHIHDKYISEKNGHPISAEVFPHNKHSPTTRNVISEQYSEGKMHDRVFLESFPLRAI